jgi:hypothetical protein
MNIVSQTSLWEKDDWQGPNGYRRRNELVDDRPLIIERVRSFLCGIGVVLLASFHLELGFAGSNTQFELLQYSAIGGRKV